MYERIRDGRQIQAFDFHKSLSPPQIQLLFGVRNCLCPAQCQGRIRKKNPPIGKIHLGGHRPSRSTDISRPKKKILETSENRKDIFPLERRDFLFSLPRPFDIVDRIHQFRQRTMATGIFLECTYCTHRSWPGAHVLLCTVLFCTNITNI